MPHYVYHRARWGAEDATVHWTEYFVSAGYLGGSLAFSVGSYLFCPSLGAHLVLGAQLCKDSAEYLFVFGCTIFLVFSVWDVVEATMACAPCSEIFERFLFFWGSIIFAVGTVLHTPVLNSEFVLPTDLRPRVGWHRTENFGGTVLFLLGSLAFAAASFVNALDLSAPEDRVFSRWAVAACSIYEFGGVLFIVGSALYFAPDLEDCAPWLKEAGSVCYLIGSVAYLIGDCIGFHVLRLIGGNSWRRVGTDEIVRRESRSDSSEGSGSPGAAAAEDEQAAPRHHGFWHAFWPRVLDVARTPRNRRTISHRSECSTARSLSSTST